jgi:hypothetical protein
LAGCATDDLIGYYEVNKDKERVRVPAPWMASISPAKTPTPL